MDAFADGRPVSVELAVEGGVNREFWNGSPTMTREEAEAIATRARPGWQFAKLIEVDDESGPSYEIQIVQGANRRVLLVAANEEVVGERE